METEETRNSGLGIFLPEPAGRAVNVWRRLYDPSFDVLWPHITLAYPPFVPPDEWPRVRPIIVACLANFEPFQVTLRETGFFLGNPDNVLWLKPEEGDILIRLRRALERALPQYIPPLPFDYQPHISIGFFQDLGALRLAQEKVKNELVPVVFRASHVAYAFQLLDGSRRIYDYVPIGGGKSQVNQNAEFGWGIDR